MNYSAAERTDSLPVCHRLPKPACYFPFGKPPSAAGVGAETPVEGLCPQDAHFWVSLNPSLIIIHSFSLSVEALSGCCLSTNDSAKCTEVETGSQGGENPSQVTQLRGTEAAEKPGSGSRACVLGSCDGEESLQNPP